MLSGGFLSVLVLKIFSEVKDSVSLSLVAFTVELRGAVLVPPAVN